MTTPLLPQSVDQIPAHELASLEDVEDLGQRRELCDFCSHMLGVAPLGTSLLSRAKCAPAVALRDKSLLTKPAMTWWLRCLQPEMPACRPPN